MTGKCHFLERLRMDQGQGHIGTTGQDLFVNDIVASALNFVIVPSGSPLPSLKSKERLQFDDFFF